MCTESWLYTTVVGTLVWVPNDCKLDLHIFIVGYCSRVITRNQFTQYNVAFH